jgi:hypothetical protein
MRILLQSNKIDPGVTRSERETTRSLSRARLRHWLDAQISPFAKRSAKIRSNAAPPR